jgi:serine/threonine protein kinase/Tol biopolymer transport system component
MIPERWRQIDELVELALEQESSVRPDFLDKACSGDEELRREVESLLAAHEQAENFIEAPALEAAAKQLAEDRTRSLMGKLLGPFKILSLLGSGGMGEVYLARDTRLERAVALKVLPAELVDNPERMKRFVQEAKAASSLNHPNIATVYEVGEADGIQWIAMEYVEGQTLEWRIGTGADPRVRPTGGARGGTPLSIDTILDIGMQMSEAVEAAHKKGIIHRDLKPANIMLTAEGRVKVLDFGLAKRVRQEPPIEGTVASTDSQTMPGVIVGTVAYMSPEQVLGQEVDHRTDLFSLGVVLYYMVSGRLPFGGASPTETIGKILHAEPEPMGRFSRDVPLELERMVRKCLEKDRERRCQSARDLLIDLKNLQRDSDTGKVAASRAGVLRTKPRVKWLALGIGTGLALIALVAGLGFWFLHRGKETPEAPLVPVPLTTYPGHQLYPSFSPDGMQVAFNWCRNLSYPSFSGEDCHIYIKQVGVEPPFQLTHATVDDFSPAWSPDGQTIAFIRELEPKKRALMLIPQRGGPETQLAKWSVSNWNGDPVSGPYLAWTPDSKWIAFPLKEEDQPNFSLFLISKETGAKKRLTTPPTNGSWDTSPAFSPNGGTLAFSRDDVDLYLLRLGEDYKPQGEPKKVDTGHSRNLGVAWTPNGQEIVFSSGNSRTPALWRMDISKPGKPVRIGLPSDNAGEPSISETGKRLAYVVAKEDSNIWRVDLEGPGRRPGKPVLFFSSTKPEYYPAYSPDGKRIAFVSEQSGANEIWICDSDGRNPGQLTSFGGPDVQGPKWSPDGQEIAFFASPTGKSNIYVVSASRDAPRRMTTQLGQWPSWSRDGRWLYFAGLRGEKWGIWKMPSHGGEAIQVTHTNNAEEIPQESPDGKFLYYCRGWPFAQSVWKIPVDGGQETKVLDSVHSHALWTARQEGIYYFTPPHDKDRSALCLYEFASGKTRKILETERPLADVGYVAISPDGRTILYAQWDEGGSNLMLVENFQ